MDLRFDDIVEPDSNELSLLLRNERRSKVWRVLIYALCFAAAFVANSIFLQATFPETSRFGSNDDGSTAGTSSVVLVSIDGFRWDYIDMADDNGKSLAPTLQVLREEGVSASSMQPVMPTKTFPNHWTLVTGLYPAWHGIVDNNMYDKATGKSFSVKNHKDPQWWHGEPIWMTIQRHGLCAATVMWPGSEVKSPEFSMPDQYLDYDSSMPYRKRVFKTMDLLRGKGMPRGARPALVTLYLNGVDRMGHEYGPDSTEVRQAIVEADAAVESLVRQINADKMLAESTSIIIVSDHGMQKVEKKDARVLQNYISIEMLNQMRIPTTYPLGQYFNLPGLSVEAMLASLNNVTSLGDIEVMFTNHTRPEWHYAEAPYRPEVITLCKPGTALIFQDLYRTSRETWGSHGYVNTDKHMQALFIARGPHFVNSGHRIDGMRSVDVYATICRALNVTAAPNNGSDDIVAQLLVPK
eukprot:Plantae.Rhodophyta-Purpureofilum_apyrenoidigerum.ctg5413.p1 GENE.Plantae.Rhodophyta-Purpureofilum_apyrenoidigerum.ctg5413~~Plantae.Rhodophyta-Purpureofilum_apyrenoidigerum.ctg5413.p1  ORF type:complete len:466 (-),score=67.44 Plantae.Rhodophyta-Purpureofilum_apyrenoidigerum.ctg5413:295-1692(-)